MRVQAATCALLILSTFICSCQAASCCLRYARRPVACSRLLGYSIQTINTSCDISAIIFNLGGRFVCADPAMKWTQRGMKCVDDKRKTDDDVIKGRAHGAA